MEKLTISLDAATVRAVERAVADGEYASTDEAVDEALREWSDKRDVLGSFTREELRVMVEDGIASGFVPHASMDDIKAEGRHRLQSKDASR